MNTTTSNKTIHLSCQNCGKNKNKSEDTDRNAFYFTCVKCLNTCWQCGQDIGYLKEHQKESITYTSCSFCDHDTCKSCGVNFWCSDCGNSICEDCIKSGKGCNNCDIVMKQLKQHFVDI